MLRCRARLVANILRVPRQIRRVDIDGKRRATNMRIVKLDAERPATAGFGRKAVGACVRAVALVFDRHRHDALGVIQLPQLGNKLVASNAARRACRVRSDN